MKYKSLIISLLLIISKQGIGQVLPANDFEAKLKTTEKPQLIDVRTTGEYGGGHLPSAQNIDFRNVDFRKNIQGLNRSKPVFVYCLSGGRSKAAAQILKEEGFATIYDLQGGWLKWSTSLKPVEGVKKTEKGVGLTKREIEVAIAQNEVVVLDFYAQWCAPCLKMMPTVDKLAKELEGKVKFIKVDYEANEALIGTYKVDEIPAFMVYKKGVLTTKTVGVQDEAAFRKMIE